MRQSLLGLVIIGILVSLSGCGDTFLDPYDNEQRYFTVYGFLDPNKTRQTIRVIPISRFAEDIQGPAEDQAFIDARVYTRNLTDSTSTLWEHELKRLDDGSYVHLYHASFFVKAGTTYRLDIIRNDGVMASATTTVPRPPSDKVVLASGPVVQQDSTVVQEIALPDIPALWDLQAIYLVEGPSYRDRVFVPYKTPSGPAADGLWKYRLNITADQDSIIARAQRFMQGASVDTLPVTLTALGVQFRIIDENWQPLFGEEDMVKLSQPGVISNVVNGYGIFGSMGLYREEWQVSPQVANVLGYPISVDIDAGF